MDVEVNIASITNGHLPFVIWVKIVSEDAYK